VNREARDFEHLLHGDLAWAIWTVGVAAGKSLDRGTVAITSVLLCWRDRAMFQMPDETWRGWFEQHVREAARWVALHGGVVFTDEEWALWSWLCRDTAWVDPAERWTTDPDRHERALAAERAMSGEVSFRRYWTGRQKDCPPCWRCRWFDGWLPPGTPVVVEYTDPDITEACARVDAKRVEVAMRVKEGA